MLWRFLLLRQPQPPGSPTAGAAEKQADPWDESTWAMLAFPPQKPCSKGGRKADSSEGRTWAQTSQEFGSPVSVAAILV